MVEKKREWRQHGVATLGLDVVHQFDKRPMVVDIPQQVGKKDQEGGKASEPYPFIGEDATLLSQQQSDDDSKTENGDEIFFFNAESGDGAEPQPVTRFIALNGENREPGAAHPQIGLEAVGSQQAAIGQVLRRYQNGDRTE